MARTANPATNSTKTVTHRGLLRTIIMGVWVVPESQVYVLNLAYQEHVFRLFHERFPNRLSHYIGIPMATATMYAALPAPAALLLAIAANGLHLAVAARYRLWAVCGLTLGVQAALGAFAMRVLAPFYASHSGFWASPWLHVFGWSFLQYITHTIEPKFPEPWVDKGMAPRGEWFRRSGPLNFLLAGLAVIPHVFVEWSSGPRLFFLVMIRLARRFGYRSPCLEKMDADLHRIQTRSNPVLRYNDFQSETSLP